MSNPSPILSARGVHKRYELGTRLLEVLRDVSLTV